ncbi:MAG TPA: ribosome biogenesis GTPase YlqF [Firmicutes bacterium]|nr:ribosome biogenesis GTPase YlqF [Bacillota bacterium]
MKEVVIEMSNEEKSFQKTNINWYPGHMAKTKRQIKERIDLVDVVVHVVDARIPKSSFINDINEFTKNKEKILVFSKYDLCDKEETLKWKNFYEKKGYTVILSELNDKNVKNKIVDAVNSLMSNVNLKRKEKGLLPKKAKVMVVGVSNVGKSTLINNLVNKKVQTVGNMPGVTKNINMVKINDKIDLIDTPGVLWPKFDSELTAFNLASMTIIKEEVLPLDEVCVYILNTLNLYYKDILKNVFGIDYFNEEEIYELYENIGKYKNYPKVGGEPDFDRINLFIINSIKNGTLKGITFDRCN